MRHRIVRARRKSASLQWNPTSSHRIHHQWRIGNIPRSTRIGCRGGVEFPPPPPSPIFQIQISPECECPHTRPNSFWRFLKKYYRPQNMLSVYMDNFRASGTNPKLGLPVLDHTGDCRQLYTQLPRLNPTQAVTLHSSPFVRYNH